MITVTRSMPAPESLAAGTNYDGDDVKVRLWQDFYGKCYLTEMSLLPGDFEIDHLHPQGECPERKCDWTNLFPAHHNANIRRPKRLPTGGLLDPSSERNLNGRVSQWLDEEHQPHFAAHDAADLPAKNTADLLAHIHKWSALKGKDLQDAVVRYLAKVLKKMIDYTHSDTDEERLRLKNEILHMTSDRAPFTALVNSVKSVQKFLRSINPPAAGPQNPVA